MRRFKILAWVAVSLAVWCGSNAPASAQTYDFSFSSSTDSVSGSFFVTGTNVTNLQGKIIWPENPSGAGTFLFATATGQFNNPGDFSIAHTGDVSPSGDLDEVILNSSGGNSGEEFDSTTSEVFFGHNLVVTEQAPSTPAPVPGSGPLSYLALGFAGLFISRKRLWRAAAMRPRSSARHESCKARAFCWRVGVHRLHDIRPVHNRLGQSRSHRRRNPKRSVDTKKIIPDRPNRDHMRVVLEFLAERIREPSEAAIVHPHCEIGALGLR
jgi:hypothetical protein